jgi:hypothetical protein
MQWSEDDTAVLAMAAAGGTEIMKALDEGGNTKDVTGVGKAIIANLALSKGPMAGANSKVLGLAANPKKEQIFKGVDFRTFAFEYQFFPRDSKKRKKLDKLLVNLSITCIQSLRIVIILFTFILLNLISFTTLMVQKI